MRYTLDTIPVWDALKTNCSCILCRLYKKCEENYIDQLMSSGYMEPSIRVQTNQLGFCKRHYEILYSQKNSLGLALILQTRLNNIINKLEDTDNALSNKRKFLFKKHRRTDSLKNIITNSCYLCGRITNSMQRYAYTILKLNEDDIEFSQLLKQSNGFCLRHLSFLFEILENSFPPDKQTKYYREILEVSIERLILLKQRIDVFAQQYKYDAPPSVPVSKQVINEAISFLRSDLSFLDPSHDF